MTRYRIETPSIAQQASPRQMWFKVDGSAVTTTSSSAGLVAGIRAADVKDDGANLVTITFKEGLSSVPLGAVFHPQDSAVPVVGRNVTLSKTAVTYTTVDGQDNSAVNDVDGLLVIYYLEGVDVI